MSTFHLDLNGLQESISPTFSNLVLSLSRSEASRLAEENLILRQKIMALKEGDLKEAQDELM